MSDLEMESLTPLSTTEAYLIRAQSEVMRRSTRLSPRRPAMPSKWEMDRSIFSSFFPFFSLSFIFSRWEWALRFRPLFEERACVLFLLSSKLTGRIACYINEALHMYTDSISAATELSDSIQSCFVCSADLVMIKGSLWVSSIQTAGWFPSWKLSLASSDALALGTSCFYPPTLLPTPSCVKCNRTAL